MELKSKAAERDIEEGTETDIVDWIVDEITNEKIVFSHSSKNVKVAIKQDRPSNYDLPYATYRNDHCENRYRLHESDWFEDTYDVAKAYMIGFVEGINQEPF